MMLDTFAEPDDVRTMARILNVPDSTLLEATRYTEDYLLSVIEDQWPKYEARLDINKQEAITRVLQVEFRWTPARSTIPKQVEEILEALASTSTKVFGCQYPDCHCSTRCMANGRLIGPEG